MKITLSFETTEEQLEAFAKKNAPAIYSDSPTGASKFCVKFMQDQFVAQFSEPLQEQATKKLMEQVQAVQEAVRGAVGEAVSIVIE